MDLRFRKFNEVFNDDFITSRKTIIVMPGGRYDSLTPLKINHKFIGSSEIKAQYWPSVKLLHALIP